MIAFYFRGHKVKALGTTGLASKEDVPGLIATYASYQSINY